MTNIMTSIFNWRMKGYKFYKWVGITALVVIGLFRFTAGTFFDIPVSVFFIVEAILYVTAITSFIVYYRKKFE